MNRERITLKMSDFNMLYNGRKTLLIIEGHCRFKIKELSKKAEKYKRIENYNNCCSKIEAYRDIEYLIDKLYQEYESDKENI